jgi:hypothetical protein
VLYGSSWIENPQCGRCKEPITNTSLVYHDGFYFHPECWEKGKVQLGRATQLANNAIELSRFELERELKGLEHGVDILYPPILNNDGEYPPGFNSD